MADPNHATTTFTTNYRPSSRTVVSGPVEVVSSTLALSHQPKYVEDQHEDILNQTTSGSTTTVTLFKEVANLIPHASPLAQVLDCTRELLAVINDLQDNKDECEHLVEGILRFIKGLAQMKAVLHDGTPTMARLYALRLNINALKDDAETWRDWNRLESRSAIKNDLYKHCQNLSDCFQSFSLTPSSQLDTVIDTIGVDKYPISTTTHHENDRLGTFIPTTNTILSDSGGLQPPNEPSTTRVINLDVRGGTLTDIGRDQINNFYIYTPADRSGDLIANPGTSTGSPTLTPRTDVLSDFAGLQRLVQQSAGAAMFQQISRMVQSRAENLASNLGPMEHVSRSTMDTEFMLVDTDMQYLTMRVEDLALGVGKRLSDIKYGAHLRQEQNNFEHRRYSRRTGKPTRQLREAIAETLGLLNLLQDDQPEIPADVLAERMSKLSLCLRDLGMREQALGVQSFCVVFRRGIVQQNGQSLLTSRELSWSLDRLSACLWATGRREEALRAVWEAVEHYRHLASHGLEPDLAESLNNLSNRLSNLGRREEALRAIQEAVGLHRRLVASSPTLFIPDLAMSLNNLSNRLSDLGHRKEALHAAQEAVELYQHPSAHGLEPYLAESLTHLAKHLSDLGHHEEALPAIKESVKLNRCLAADRSLCFNPDLAMSLNNLSDCLSKLGRREEATQAIREAVELYRRLAASHPSVFNPELAASLNNLSSCLSDLGHREEALYAIQEAVELYQCIAADYPSAFNPNLATSLKNLSSRLSDLGRQEEALHAIQAAVKLHRHLAEKHPVAFSPDLAASLNTLSVRLSTLGNKEEALEVIQEVVELRRHLAANHPIAFNNALSVSLNNLSLCLSDVGRGDDAMRAIEESIKLSRKLAADHPAAFKHKLAQHLDSLSTCLSSLGRHEEALHAIQEAVELSRQLTADRPAAFSRDLAAFVRNQSNCLSHLSRPNEALQSAREAANLFRLLAAAHPVAFRSKYALALMDLSNCLYNVDNTQEAQKTSGEARKLLSS